MRGSCLDDAKHNTTMQRICWKQISRLRKQVQEWDEEIALLKLQTHKSTDSVWSQDPQGTPTNLEIPIQQMANVKRLMSEAQPGWG